MDRIDERRMVKRGSQPGRGIAVVLWDIKTKSETRDVDDGSKSDGHGKKSGHDWSGRKMEEVTWTYIRQLRAQLGLKVGEIIVLALRERPRRGTDLERRLVKFRTWALKICWRKNWFKSCGQCHEVSSVYYDSSLITLVLVFLQYCGGFCITEIHTY